MRRRPVVDLEHDNLVGLVVDAVEHAERSTPSRPHAPEFMPEPATGPLRVLDERSRDELDDGDCYWLRTASTPRTPPTTVPQLAVRGYAGDTT